MAAAEEGHRLWSDPACVLKAGPVGCPDNVDVAGRDERLSCEGCG